MRKLSSRPPNPAIARATLFNQPGSLRQANSAPRFARAELETPQGALNRHERSGCASLQNRASKKTGAILDASVGRCPHLSASEAARPAGKAPATHKASPPDDHSAAPMKAPAAATPNPSAINIPGTVVSAAAIIWAARIKAAPYYDAAAPAVEGATAAHNDCSAVNAPPSHRDSSGVSSAHSGLDAYAVRLKTCVRYRRRRRLDCERRYQSHRSHNRQDQVLHAFLASLIYRRQHRSTEIRKTITAMNSDKSTMKFGNDPGRFYLSSFHSCSLTV